MKKTDINLGVAAYTTDLMRDDSSKKLTKEEISRIQKTLIYSILMLNELPDSGIEKKDLDNVLANILSYIVSNGKSDKKAMDAHLRNIMFKASAILALTEQTPVAHVLDYIKGKRANPLKSMAKILLYTNKYRVLKK